MLLGVAGKLLLGVLGAGAFTLTEGLFVGVAGALGGVEVGLFVILSTLVGATYLTGFPEDVTLVNTSFLFFANLAIEFSENDSEWVSVSCILLIPAPSVITRLPCEERVIAV